MKSSQHSITVFRSRCPRPFVGAHNLSPDQDLFGRVLPSSICKRWAAGSLGRGFDCGNSHLSATRPQPDAFQVVARHDTVTTDVATDESRAVCARRARVVRYVLAAWRARRKGGHKTDATLLRIFCGARYFGNVAASSRAAGRVEHRVAFCSTQS